MNSYNPSRIYFTPTASVQIKTDNIRPVSLYVESPTNVETGHLVSWSGTPASFDSNGQRLSTWTSTNGHAFALSSVEENTVDRHPGVAGVVLERAAEPNATSFLHKGVHDRHPLKDAQHILRVGTKGAVVLAWVIDGHENTLNGVYVKHINGVAVATAVVHQLGDHFTITDTEPASNSLTSQVAILTARLDSLLSE